MPTYCYRVLGDDGQPAEEVVDVFMSSEVKKRRERKDGTIRLDDGRLAVHDVAAEHSGYRKSKGWPIRSDSMGCSADQVEEFNLDARKRGFTEGQIRFDLDGTCVIGSPVAKHKYMRSIGMIDKRSYY